MERARSSSPCKSESEDSLPKFDIFGNEPETTENYLEEDLKEKKHSKPDIVVPQAFLNIVSMPKNWSQVEKLKQKRSLLHEQLFGQKLNVEKNGNVKLQGADKLDSVQSESIQSVIENKQSATETNLIQRVEGNIDTCELGNSKVESCRIDEENFDLSSITASEINENFRQTISSVRKRTKEECQRIKKVLKSIKSKCQELNNMNSEIKEYHIPKLSVSDGDITKDSVNNKDTISDGLKEENHIEKPLIHKAKNATNISEIETTKYVGLPVNFSLMSESLQNLDNNLELSKSNRSLISSDGGQIKSLPQTSSKESVKSKESFDYKNIALQKLKAEQRLKEICKLQNTDIDNGDIKGTASDVSIKDVASLDYANIAFRKYLAEQRLKLQHKEKTDLKETISETVKLSNSAASTSCTSQAVHVDDAAKDAVSSVNDIVIETNDEILETINHLKHAVLKKKEHSDKAKELKQQVLENLKAKQESNTRRKSPATERKIQLFPFRQFMNNRSEKENCESENALSDKDVLSDDVDGEHADLKRVLESLKEQKEKVICDNNKRKTTELNENKANEKRLNINSQLQLQNDLMSTNASKKRSKRASSAGTSKRKKTKTQTKNESIQSQADANTVPQAASVSGTSKTLSSALVDSIGAANAVKISKMNEIPLQQVHTTYWAPMELSRSLKTDTTAILQSRQDLSSQSVMVGECGEIILPLRPTDVGSKKYNSYNGQPCVMIDGQANLRVINGKVITILGDPLPTTSYKDIHAVVGNPASKPTSFIPNTKQTSHVQPTSITVGSNRFQLQPASATSLYRFPVSFTALTEPGMVQNAKLGANQPVNLLFVPHNQNINSQYSLIRVPRSSVQTRSVTNNLLRLPVNVAVSQNPELVLSDKSVKTMVTTAASTLPKTTFPLSNSPMQASAKNTSQNCITTVNSTVSASAASERASGATSSRPQDTVTSLMTKYRCISPRSAKCLLTNQTYRCYDSIPAVNSLTSVPAATSANQLTAAYIGSVVLGSQQMNSPLSCSEAHAKPINGVQNSDEKTRAKAASAKSDSSTPTIVNEKVTSVVKEPDGNLSKQNDAAKPVTGNNSNNVKTSPSTCFYSSIDTLSSVALPKDKGNKSIHEKMPLENDLGTCTEESAKHGSNMTKRSVSGKGEKKTCNPLPFLDYPARIVANKLSNNGSKIVISSPRGKGKSSLDTSLDEEKMTKMIAFAKEIEEENENQRAINEQKHRANFSKTNESLDSSTKNKESEVSADVEVEGKNSSQNSEKLITQMNDKPDSDRKNSGPVKFIKEPNSQIVTDKNMLDDLEDSPPTNKLHIALSNDESVDSYDSSDLESYEKFVAGRKVNTSCLKRKNVLIDSYFTSQGLSDMKKYNIDPKPSYPLAGIYSTSKSSSKIIEDSSNSKKNSLNVGAENSELKSLSSSNNADNLEIDSVIAKMKSTSNSNLRITKNSTTVLPKAAGSDKQQLGDSRSSVVSDGNKNSKRFIKTKFIILKGEICDRWFEVKKKTGYGEMSDPKFIQYLLRLEEERQNKMNQPLMSTPKAESVEDIETSYEILRFSPLVIAQDGAVDINNNNNNFYVQRRSPVDIDQDTELLSDLEDTIVNVTDTPPNSPFLRNRRKPKNCQVCVGSSSEDVSEDKTDKDQKVDRAITMPGQCAKRSAEEMDDLESPASKKKCSVLSDATQKHIDRAVRLFREWLQKRGDNEDFENKSSPWLDDRLAHFYVEAHTKDLRPYTADFLQMFRRTLSLYLAASGKNVQVSISHDIEFYRSNQILAGLLKTQYSTKQWEASELIKTQGTTEVASKTNKSDPETNIVYTISGADFEKLYSTRTLSDDNPTCLLWKVWFDITFHLCKGKVSKNFWRSLKKQSLKLKSDVNGVFYTFTDYIPIEEEPGRMYATPNEPEKCPVRTTSLYLHKLCANCDSLFQVPKMSWSEGIERWYLPVPLSCDKLDKIMCAISEHANLSVVYNTLSVLLTAKVRGIQSK